MKYDEKVSAVVDSDSASLAQKANALVAQLRDFIERHKRVDDSIRENEWNDLARATDDAEKRRLWEKFTSASLRHSTETHSEYERRFKVDAMLLRDELRSRLKDYTPDQRTDREYEHPVNYFGYNDVAADIERMAKLMSTGR